MNKAAFIIPAKLNGTPDDLGQLRLTVESIKNQTDKDWIIILIDDFSDNDATYEVYGELKVDLGDKIHILYSDKNYGTGAARNKGVAYAASLGVPFILFNDSDDISDPRRLELVRAAFEDPKVNVVYTSFDIINENGDPVPKEKINPSIQEIIDGHKKDIVEGELAWIQITTKKKYTNLTSCTAARTSLAIEEPFPSTSVSEDSHTWVRYGAHPGKFVFLRDIKGHYRIRTGTASRSRANNPDFYKRMYEVDVDGFEQGVILAKKYGTMGGYDENDLRVKERTRLALSLYNGGDLAYCKKSLNDARSISLEKTLEAIDKLPCDKRIKEQMRRFCK